MAFSPALTTVAQTIQISLAPVFLLTGIGGVLNVLTVRLGRVVDRARGLEREYASLSEAERSRYVRELRLLDRRMNVVNAAMGLCVASAMAICLVVAALFIAELAQLRLGQFVAIAFIVAMLLLMAGLVLFMIEVRLSVRGIRVRADLLAIDRR